MKCYPITWLVFLSLETSTTAAMAMLTFHSKRYICFWPQHWARQLDFKIATSGFWTHSPSLCWERPVCCNFVGLKIKSDRWSLFIQYAFSRSDFVKPFYVSNTIVLEFHGTNFGFTSKPQAHTYTEAYPNKWQMFQIQSGKYLPCFPSTSHGMLSQWTHRFNCCYA